MIDFTGIYWLDRFRNSMAMLAKALKVSLWPFQDLYVTQVRDHAKDISFVSYIFRNQVFRGQPQLGALCRVYLERSLFDPVVVSAESLVDHSLDLGGIQLRLSVESV